MINKIETAFQRKRKHQQKNTREQTKLNGYGTDWNVKFSPGLHRKLTANNMTEEE